MSVMGEPNVANWAAQRASGFGGNMTVVDKVPPDMLHLVDAYWYQFAPMNPLWHGILGFTIGVLGFISVVGNGMVVYIFLSTKPLRTPSNLLVVNLAFSDFLMMFTMSPSMVINCYHETWVLGPLFCELYGMFGSLFGCGSIWTMVFIALDRYVPEGNMTACGTDYLNKDPISRSYIVVYAMFVYFIPLFTIIYAYFFIVQVKILNMFCLAPNLLIIHKM
ncbi:unnamed protein product [Acanthoscelides obtectus]|uniref:G-protein coupled receptors family 1 profile domain-containing protein n=1 Tax=Acanthoscelides obtectus TaxID=200917 RepID=A0A9P0LU86_ACAOB|nr:unnamed protein product [Acanthoscelides obtectus]CAK1629824.1 hypothetical protein AOBTE_LOCUS5978 [Acanthoscelides obtectus]